MAFIIVKYGDSQEDVFNPNCRSFNLLKCIQKRCKCNDDVELSDENGNIKFLRESPNRYANELLSDREPLVLLRVEKKESHGEIYVPMLNEEYISDEFRTRIATKGSGETVSSATGRRVRSNTRRNKKEKDDKSKSNRAESLRSAKTDVTVKRSRSRQGK